MIGLCWPQLARIRSGLILLTALVLVGCSPGAASLSPSPPVAQPPTSTATPVVQATPAGVAQTPLATEAQADTAPPGPTPTIRRGLHATDPGSVVLASGRPQLVEFFAFW
jgi:hypothetical protein